MYISSPSRCVRGGKISENKTRYVMPKFLDTARPQRRIFLLSTIWLYTISTVVSPIFLPRAPLEICCLKFCMRSLERDRCDNCRVDLGMSSKVEDTENTRHIARFRHSPLFLLTPPACWCAKLYSHGESDLRGATTDTRHGRHR